MLYVHLMALAVEQ